MKSLIIKGTIGLLSASGLGAGGYYTYQALNKKEEKQKEIITIQNSLIKEGYTPFSLDLNGWKGKFKAFKNDETNGSKFATVLKAKYTNLVVDKSQETEEGGEKLQKWCEEVLAMKKEEKNEHQNLANAKLFCATAPSTNVVGGG